jgi:D-aminoacyl-tRNA deacylase
MRAILQRVLSASVTVENEIIASIGNGLLILAGQEASDTEEDLDWLTKKVVGLRLFKDETGEMKRSVLECGGEILVVSQFTLFASTKKGTRPSWHRAASPEIARPLYEALIAKLVSALGRPVAAGRFGAMMEVASINDGPVTLIIDTKARE